MTRQAIDQEWRAAGQSALALTSRLGSARVVGVPGLIGHLVANLVQNAIRHNHAGGWVEVVIETITDSERGSGLGLSIVRAVAERHDATVMAVALPAGGLSVTIAFPLAAG